MIFFKLYKFLSKNDFILIFILDSNLQNYRDARVFYLTDAKSGKKCGLAFIYCSIQKWNEIDDDIEFYQNTLSLRFMGGNCAKD